MAELVSVKATSAAAARAALFIVIWPLALFSVTPVALLDACVTTPPAPVAYPTPAVAPDDFKDDDPRTVVKVPGCGVPSPIASLTYATRLLRSSPLKRRNPLWNFGTAVGIPISPCQKPDY